MEPILTLAYSEWLVAEHLMKALRARQGYSVYAPLSRQERAVDLILTRRLNGVTRAATLQIKYGRVFVQKPTYPFTFEALFKRFQPQDADFFVLVTLYPNITGRGGGSRKSWWLPLLLLFTRDEMNQFMSSLHKPTGEIERHMFYIAFDTPTKVVLTRGGGGKTPDLTKFRFQSRLPMLRDFLSRSRRAVTRR
jgi:hypothetical protein